MVGVPAGEVHGGHRSAPPAIGQVLEVQLAVDRIVVVARGVMVKKVSLIASPSGPEAGASLKYTLAA